MNHAPIPSRVTILGMQGAGKGTIGRSLAEAISVPFVSVGDLLRLRAKSDDDVGVRILRRTEQGEFVDDEIVDHLLAERLAKPDAERGFVLDGYPRRKGQDASLDRMLAELPSPASLDHAIYLSLTPRTALERLSQRLLCDRCGLPAALAEVPEHSACSSGCGGIMRRRGDDLARPTIERRHAIFESVTVPLIEDYARRGLLVTIDAGQSKEAVLRSIGTELSVDV